MTSDTTERRNRTVGPDIAIVGAARAGTSFLSAVLGRHTQIDPGMVKEPNYFSSRWEDGEDWYDQLYTPRTAGVLCLDSSVSYTYPQHPKALQRLRAVVPDVKVIYTVRRPVDRLVSHYQLFRYYTQTHDWNSLGEALTKSEMLLGSSDYDHWLATIRDLFPPENVLVIPFPLITKDMPAVLDSVLPWLGLEHETALLESDSGNYRNEIRQFRFATLQHVHNALTSSRYYPRLRQIIGADRLRSLRRAVTRRTDMPSAQAELATLTASQHREVRQVSARAVEAVSDWLADQDSRHGVSWLPAWSLHESSEA